MPAHRIHGAAQRVIFTFGIMRYLKLVLYIQGIYYMFTGLWALMDIESFMAFTGPKTDIWLVKTFSLLYCCIGLTLILHKYQNPILLFPTILACLTSIVLAFVDLHYSFNGTISKVYQLDGAIQLFFLAGIALSVLKKELKYEGSSYLR